MKIKELLNDPEKWTRNYYARTIDAYPVSASTPTAVCWCLKGALIKCYDDFHDYIRIHEILDEKTGGIAIWNDNPNRKFEEVKKLVEELDI